MLCLVTKKMLRKEAADGLVDVVKELNGEISASAVGDVDIDKNIGESEDNHTNDRDRHLHITSLVVNINKEDTNVILGKECVTLYGKPYIEDYIGDIKSFRLIRDRPRCYTTKHLSLQTSREMKAYGICTVA